VFSENVYPSLTAAATPGTHTGPLRWEGRTGLIALGLIVCLGLAVRVRQYCAEPSFWYDEAYLLVNIADKTCLELCGPLRGGQTAPPGFLLALRCLYIGCGASEWAMRLPTLLASVAALGISIPLARRIAGRPGWLWAVGFCALSHHAVTHGIEVKPYAVDLLVSELILLAAINLLRAEPLSTRWRWHVAGMFAIALVGPWLSYPSAFVLGGVSLALAADAWARRRLGVWGVWSGFTAMSLLSFAAVWLLVARHQRTEMIQAYWQTGFAQDSSLGRVLLWIGSFPVNVADYGSTSLGIPLALLGLWGVAALWRHSRPAAALLVGPLAVALFANLLRLYPLDDRLLFFAAPCLWLSAAAGVSDIVNRSRGRFAWLVVIALSALLVPGTARFTKYLLVVKAKTEYREAFEHVLREESAGDLWWITHPEVAEVYLGSGRAYLNGTMPPGQVAEAARGRRLWLVVCIPQAGPLLAPELEQQLERAGLRATARRDWQTIVVLLYAPAAPSLKSAGIGGRGPGG
jgi:uncharacterized membrane protein